MKRTIFESMFSVEQPKTRFKWLFFPVSLLLHGVLVAAIVAVPLMMADNMPVMKITDVFMVAPTPPAPPGPPKGKSGSKKPTTKPDGPKRPPKPSKPKVTGFI
ncbi:MAG: hypothetical protein GY950_12040, partial [bacterium]|nr:hypothetical protein [bacterium]